MFNQTLIYNRKRGKKLFINESAFIWKSLKKSSMLLPPDPDSHVEEVKQIYLQCCVWLNAVKTSSIDFYEWKVRGNHNWTANVV